MERADSVRAGGDASPGRAAAAGSSQSAVDYKQLALYLAGNALTILILLLIWNLNTVRRG